MTDPAKPPPPSPPAANERRATVRIDAQPGGKRFQGVWLELADGERWVIDYRPRTPWTWFADAEVAVTGACYQPEGQAINAVHFRVERMRFATPPAPGSQPYLALGPERVLHGRFVEVAAPAGSKLAGTVETRFIDDAGASYGIAGVERARPPAGDPLRITAREVTPDLAYAAQSGGPQLWVLDVAPGDADPPRVIPCE